jgi:Diaminopimelate epimerase
MFPDKCNLTLAEKINKNLIKVRVWERGAGLTKACGTAACATAVAANLDNLSNSRTEIEFSLGKLIINIDKKNSIHMKGPVSNIKEIKINL